tara:strand:+ start:415 stop:615 length:201 start_codon:yes stop_codon:yes gene_type:complete
MKYIKLTFYTEESAIYKTSDGRTYTLVVPLVQRLSPWPNKLQRKSGDFRDAEKEKMTEAEAFLEMV